MGQISSGSCVEPKGEINTAINGMPCLKNKNNLLWFLPMVKYVDNSFPIYHILQLLWESGLKIKVFIDQCTQIDIFNPQIS